MVRGFMWVAVLVSVGCLPDPGIDPERVVVEIQSPVVGEVYTEGEEVTLEAHAVDSDGAVVEVDGFSWQVVDGEWSQAGNSLTVTDLPVGSLTLEVVAAVGEHGVVDTVEFSVVSDQPEVACDDGEDNDGDGLADCDDDDCVDRAFCGWPTHLSHTGSFYFDASFLAELAGYPSCLVAFNASLDRIQGSGECPGCDRTFGGDANYTDTACAESASELPAEVSYGVVFASDTSWRIFASDGDSWGESGVATGGNGTYTLSREDPVEYDGQDGGTLETILTFIED
jgi:hypothetical protein